jgi:Bacterial Ig-like domain (group 3)/FG-GAP-like repeat
MKLACVLFVFSIFASTVLLTQSNSVPPGNSFLVPTIAAADAPQTPVSSFTAPAVYNSGGDGGLSVAVADLNGDGKLDLVVANQVRCNSCSGGSVSVLLGNGDGTLQAAVSYSSGGYSPASVAVADVNGDGKVDLVVANQLACNSCASGSVSVLLGNGDGTFQAAVSYGSGGFSADSVAVADVNGDGKPDLVVMNQAFCGFLCGNGQVGVLLGKGDGTFQTAVIYDSGAYLGYSVAVADVNGDGKLDLVVANGSTSRCLSCGVSTFGVLLGNGNGSFKPVVTYALFADGGLSMSLAVADVNGDLKPDLVVTNDCHPTYCSSSSVSVLLGKGDGTFQAPAIYDSGGPGAMSLAVADVNGDGKPDLVVASNNPFSYFYCGSGCQRGQAAVLLGNGDGTFQGPVTYDSGAYFSEAVAVADVNGDGKPDLVVANLCAVSKNCNGASTVRGAVSVLISAPAATTSLVSSRNPSIFGQAVTFTATVSSSLGTPTGKVTFQGGGAPLAAVSVSGGIARYTTSKLPSGLNHVITALYGGDSKNGSSLSAPVYQSVFAKSATTLTSSPNPSTSGQAVTFTATVTSNIGAPPDGEPITFMKGTAVLGPGTLSGGSAGFTTSTLPVGTSHIKAVYGGDSTLAGSKSTALKQVVN